MSPNELIELKKGIVYMAAYYGRDLKDGVVQMMASDLEDLPYKEVAAAYQAYRRNPKNKTMPMPAEIRGMIQPIVNHDAKARDVASRIPHAITRFGHSNPEEARAYIGEVGWDIVQSSGGWSYLCQNHGVNIDPGQFMAQTRDRLRDRFEYGKDAIQAQVIEHRPKEERLMIERDTQKARLEQWQIEDVKKRTKPDPNAEYSEKSPEEREAMVKEFLANLKTKEMP